MTGSSADPIIDFFDGLAQSRGPVITDWTSPSPNSFKGDELIHLIDCYARALTEVAGATDWRILGLVDNSIETVLLVLASLRHGFRLALTPASLSESQIQLLSYDLGPTSLISTSKKASLATRVQLSDIRDFSPLPVMGSDPDGEFLTTFTSGSTSQPKAVVHSARSLLNCANSFNLRTGVRSSSVSLNVMPMSYMAGVFNSLITPLQAQSRVVLLEQFNAMTAIRFWKIIADEEITSTWLSPTMLKMLVELDRGNELKSDSPLSQLYVGTGSLAADIAEECVERLGIVPLQSYGLSETLFVSVDDVRAPKFGTVGFPLDEVLVEPSSEGTLQISTPHMFMGYLKNLRLLKQDGPFITSDLGEVLENGRLSVFGRADDTVIRGGVNISPEHVEAIIFQITGLSDCCVLGLPDKALGQRLCAIFQHKASSRISVEALRDSVSQELPNSRLDSVYFVDEIPRGPTGKLQRQKLKSLLLQDHSNDPRP